MFTLRAILLWTVNDFPAYGLIFGQQTKGYCGCPICVIETCAIHSNALKKMLYLGNRRWLPPDHRFRRAHISFDGHQEMRPAPSRPSGHDILYMGEEQVSYLGSGGRQDGEDDPVKQHGVKRVSVLYELPYWVVSFNSVTPMFTNSLCDSSVKRILLSITVLILCLILLCCKCKTYPCATYLMLCIVKKTFAKIS